jgi:hypothetical protein
VTELPCLQRNHHPGKRLCVNKSKPFRQLLTFISVWQAYQRVCRRQCATDCKPGRRRCHLTFHRTRAEPSNKKGSVSKSCWLRNFGRTQIISGDVCGGSPGSDPKTPFGVLENGRSPLGSMVAQWCRAAVGKSGWVEFISEARSNSLSVSSSHRARGARTLDNPLQDSLDSSSFPLKTHSRTW